MRPDLKSEVDDSKPENESKITESLRESKSTEPGIETKSDVIESKENVNIESIQISASPVESNPQLSESTTALETSPLIDSRRVSFITEQSDSILMESDEIEDIPQKSDVESSYTIPLPQGLVDQTVVKRQETKKFFSSVFEQLSASSSKETPVEAVHLENFADTALVTEDREFLKDPTDVAEFHSKTAKDANSVESNVKEAVFVKSSTGKDQIMVLEADKAMNQSTEVDITDDTHHPMESSIDQGANFASTVSKVTFSDAFHPSTEISIEQGESSTKEGSERYQTDSHVIAAEGDTLMDQSGQLVIVDSSLKPSNESCIEQDVISASEVYVIGEAAAEVKALSDAAHSSIESTMDSALEGSEHYETVSATFLAVEKDGSIDQVTQSVLSGTSEPSTESSNDQAEISTESNAVSEVMDFSHPSTDSSLGQADLAGSELVASTLPHILIEAGGNSHAHSSPESSMDQIAVSVLEYSPSPSATVVLHQSALVESIEANISEASVSAVDEPIDQSADGLILSPTNIESETIIVSPDSFHLPHFDQSNILAPTSSQETDEIDSTIYVHEGTLESNTRSEKLVVDLKDDNGESEITPFLDSPPIQIFQRSSSLPSFTEKNADRSLRRPKSDNITEIAVYESTESTGVASDQILASFSFSYPRKATAVFLTGTFDNWTKSIQMHQSMGEWIAQIKLDPSKEHQYKFVVDGIWMIDESKDRMMDLSGNINNYLCPNSSQGMFTYYASQMGSAG